MRDERVRSRRASRAFAAALALVVLGAALLRLSGIDYLLPQVMNRDGLVIIRQIELFRSQAQRPAAWEWWYTSYPHLMARLASLAPAVEAVPGRVLSLEEHLALARAPWVELRILSILLSLLAIPGTYLLARRFLDRGSALFAAAALATSLHHVCLSIQEKPHAAATTFVLLALLSALRLRRKPDILSYVLCGITAALAVGVLHNGIACLPPLVAAFCLSGRSERRPSRAWVAVPIAMVVLSAKLFYPFYFESSGDLGAGLPSAGRIAELFGGAPIQRLAKALWSLDPLFVTAAGAGILLAGFAVAKDRVRRRDLLRGDPAVILSFALPYLLVLSLFQGTLVRFFLPIFPILACAAGYAFSRARVALFSGVRSALPRGACTALLAALLLAFPLRVAWHFARIRCRPGPLEEAAHWITANADPDEVVVVVPRYDLPLLETQDAIAANRSEPYRTIWSEYLARASPESLPPSPEATRWKILIEPGERPASRFELTRDPLGYFRRYGARRVVLDLSGGGGDLLQGKAERSIRFSPSLSDDSTRRGNVLFGKGYDPLAPSALSILDLRSFGTTVEIYRLP